MTAGPSDELQLPDQLGTARPGKPGEEENDLHERFVEARLLTYQGRLGVYGQLAEYADGPDGVPLVVTGSLGLGKSSALARFVTDYRRTHPDTTTVAHFVGASPRSTSLREMLHRLAQNLQGPMGLADVPDDLPSLLVAVRDGLSRPSGDRRVLLVIDAVNQLDRADQASGWSWLPEPLPPQVKVVVSCLDNGNQAEPLLEAIRRRPHREVALEPLSDEDRRAIIRAVPSLSAKTLDEQQIGLLLENPATANPLYLQVALEELRGFGSFEALDDRIRAFPRGPEAVTTLFDQVLDRLEGEFGTELVRLVLILLASARYGLAERELLALLRAAAIPDPTDLFVVLRQLRSYLLKRAELVDFYHDTLRRAVARRYLWNAELRRTAHACLAEFFAEQADRRDGQVNERKAEELFWHRLRSGQSDEAVQLLKDIHYLELKAEAGLVFGLPVELAAARETGTSRPDEGYLLALLEEAVRRDLHFLSRHPETLFQCLWNRCWWYDQPGSSAHYHAEGEAQSEHPAKRGNELSALLESWRRIKAQESPGFRWVRSLRPPEDPLLGSGLRAVFEGHEAEVSALAFSADGRTLASASWDRTVRLWDVATGPRSPASAATREECPASRSSTTTARWSAVPSTGTSAPGRRRVVRFAGNARPVGRF